MFNKFLLCIFITNMLRRIYISSPNSFPKRNVPNPFEFNYTENTITGYRVGIKLGNGMILSYIFRRSFRDIDGDGQVNGPDEEINMTSIETSFSF